LNWDKNFPVQAAKVIFTASGKCNLNYQKKILPMFLDPSKKLSITVLACIMATVSIFTVSCQKELSGEGFIVTETPPDLTTKISSSVSGFVTDEADAAVNGATVQLGTSSTTTDKYGYFEFSNVDVVKNAAVVTVLKPGYFKGIKTYIAAANKAAFFRIKLLPKTTAGSFDAAAGGTVTLVNGLSVTFPADAVVVASSGVAYSGQVNMAAQWLNPTANDLNRTMPGDLRGLDSVGIMKILTTYGMAAVELTGGSGELLQIATGKKATMNFPIPASIASSAPANIPLWSFDETKGLWKQEGHAVKTGNNYVGDVSHFSFWNCDVPANFVQFSCTVKDATGAAVHGALVKISVTGGSPSTAWGYTDSFGYVGGAVPVNSQLLLEVFSNYSCANASVSQTFTTTTANVSLGDITVAATNYATVSGNVLNCTNAPVTDGYIIMIIGNLTYRYPVSATGTFSFTTLLCTNNTPAVLVAEDNEAMQAGNPVNITLTAGANAAGTVTACGTSIEQFINYTINGTDYTLTAPEDSFYHYVNIQPNPATGEIAGYTVPGSSTGSVFFRYTQEGIGLNSTQTLVAFSSQQMGDSLGTTITTPINLNITEYGAPGEFISGNFTGTLVGPPPANTPYNVTCSFRVRRRM
jgi:hypothetical protein